MIHLNSLAPNKLNLHFFAVPPKSCGPFQKAIDLFDEKCEGYCWDTPTPKPLRNVLITPINIGPQSKFLPYVRDLKDSGRIERIIFDSGGYSLMTGTLEKTRNISTVEALVEKDMKLYEENANHVDAFMMLDDPPTGADNFDTVQKKIGDTIRVTLDFFNQMSSKVQDKCVPIYHCQHLDEVEIFTEAYAPIIQRSGFVSYSAASTTMPNASRLLGMNSVPILKKIVNDLQEVHCLGIVSPLATFLLALLGVRTYDGSSASINAGNGEVYLPYQPSIPMTTNTSKSHRVPSQKEFDLLKEETGHHCPFCSDINVLIKTPEYRFLHNLIVVDQLPYIYKDLDIEKFRRLQKTQKYTKLIDDFLTESDQLLLF